jgi:hypothetical protein
MMPNEDWVFIKNPIKDGSRTTIIYIRMYQCCQMVYFQTQTPNLSKFWRALGWKMFMYIFYGHLEYFADICDILWPFVIFYNHLWYFMTICDILWPFVIFYDHLVHFVYILYIFPVFGIMYHEKSGNPGMYCVWSLRPQAGFQHKILFPIWQSLT